MSQYKTPGVYVEEKSVLPGSVAGVSTAVPAFIGYTGGESNLVDKAVKVSTLKQYEDTFGKGSSAAFIVEVTDMEEKAFTATAPESADLMYYAMQMFFSNGGQSCYVVSVADKTSKESYSNALNALELEDEPTLIVLVDAVNLPVSKNYYTLCDEVLTQCNKMKDRFGIFDVIPLNDYLPAPAADKDIFELFRTDIGSNNLKYGAAYYPYLKSGIQYYYNENDLEITIPDPADSTKTKKVKLNDSIFTTENTELYNLIKKKLESIYVTLPPSSAVAGAYVSTDRDRGVWKAPANTGLTSVLEPAVKLTELENDGMNVDPTGGKSVNAIRSFTGKGTLIWGARTLAGNDNEWRYISVRRLFNYVEESIQKATSFAVFEPNNAMTWLKLRSMIESFLDTLWREGALAGGKPEDAYFVQVGLGTTMTPQDILEGKLIIKIGLAAVRPAEFIILEFTHKLQES